MKRVFFLALLLLALTWFAPDWLLALTGGFSVALMGTPPNPDRWKPIMTKDFVSGGDVKFNLKELGAYRYRAFLLYFTGTFNKAGASGFGTLATEAPFTLARYVAWVDKINIKRLPARFLRQISHLMYRAKDTTYTAPTATNSNETIQFSLIVDNEYYGTDSPYLSILDLSRASQNAELSITFGTVEDLIAGGNYTTKTITGATIQVFGLVDESKG